MIPLSLYVHIPWCVQKCPYCDFNSHRVKQPPDYAQYVQHLLQDLEQDLPLAGDRALSSIFIGGGTPSLLPAEAMHLLLDGIRQRIAVDNHAEITMEANPNSADIANFKAYQQAGINRLSIGVQSFQPSKLQRLGRVHNPQEAIQAATIAKQLGFPSFNLDLMHGLPQQSVADALSDLEQAIALQPTHLSWYQLTIEPNTLFGSQPPTLPDDDTLWQIYQQGHQLLTAAGYQQYETSAYAKAGYQCRHNLNYWRFGDYLGIGCGAHGKLTQADQRILRTVKIRHPQGYLRGEYRQDCYQVAANELPFEYFMNRFRLHEAAAKAEFSQRTFLPFKTVANQFQQAEAQGYLTQTQTDWQLTAKGKLFLNSLLEMFLD